MLGDLQPDRRMALRAASGTLLAAAGVTGTAAGRAESNSTAPSDSGQGRCDLTVDDDDEIQDAVDDADDGDTVCVEPGTYEESITVGTDDLTLRATDAREATIDARGESTGVAIEADGVTLEGFEIVGDGDTSSGVSIVTEETAIEALTVENNHIHGMARPGGGGAFQVSSWGILAWGSETLSGVTIEDNTIESIGGEPDALPIGVGIDLEEVDGSRPGEGAVIRRNEIAAVANATVSLDDFVDMDLKIDGVGEIDLPGVGIAIRPLEEGNSDAEDPATDVRQNEIADTWIDVLLGEVELARVMGNEERGDG